MEQEEYLKNTRWIMDDDCEMDSLEKKVEKAERLGEEASDDRNSDE